MKDKQKQRERYRRYHQKYHHAPKWVWELGGLPFARLYMVWVNILQRTKYKNPFFMAHGGNAFTYANCTICEEWLDFRNFLAWSLANGWDPNSKEKLTIDRIDNEKGYSPENCRWVNWSVQMKNRRMTEKQREACRRNWRKALAAKKAKREARILIQLELFGG